MKPWRPSWPPFCDVIDVIDSKPAPILLVSSDTSSVQASILSSIDFSKHLPFVHYNVESVFQKLDVLFAELRDLDILAFSETWLNNSISTDDLLLQQYHLPERKDRIGDSNGGVMIYVRENIYYTFTTLDEGT